MKNYQKWVFCNHQCWFCGGEILQSSGGGASGGGNPMFVCAGCKVSTSHTGPDCFCFCAVRQDGSSDWWGKCKDAFPVVKQQIRTTR